MATRWPSFKYKKPVHRPRECICSEGAKGKDRCKKGAGFRFVGCVKEKMEQAEPVGARQSEDHLLCTLTEAMRELEAVSVLQSPRGRGAEAGRHCGEEMHEEEHGGVTAASGAERRCMQKVLVVLKELSISHTERMAAWSDALSQCVRMLANQPQGGSKQQHQGTDGTEAFFESNIRFPGFTIVTV